MIDPASMLRRLSASLALLAAAVAPLAAQQTDPSLLTVSRIFGTPEFRPESFGPAVWLDGASYTTVEDAASGPGRDIVRYDAATGARTVLVTAASLTLPGRREPLAIDDYSWSAGQRHLLVFTNSKPVWRLNTRGDYWVLDRTSGALRQIGTFAQPSTLMYAKFSPDGTRVGYVVENNLYVEQLATGAVTQLTRDGSRTVINGNFDWVYEEELGLHDGWQWSPDGRRIAYWQLTADRVRDFFLLRNTDSLYSQVVPIQYPKAGEENSAARIGVVDAAGSETTWLRFEGDPRNHYLARMDWAASSDELLVQRLNRLQNANEVVLADARTGAVRTLFVDRDSAWVDVVDTQSFPPGALGLVWVDGGKYFTFVSERDGWRHAYLASRDGKEFRLLTPGAFDVLDVVGVDAAGGWLYYVASPDDPAQRYLWRTRLDGKGRAERLSPADRAGSNGYAPAPGFRYAFHTYSRLGLPTTTALVDLPRHRELRVLAGNAALKGRVAALRSGGHEFLQVAGADGAVLNAWLMKPADFDPAKRYPILFFVYGGPGSQTVMDAWGGSQYLWHLLLTQRGYLVASVDNRGTGARGSAFRKAIYRQLGVVETRDQIAAAREFAKLPFVDASRMGIWGWSYGGFMSLNGLFQGSDVYRMAMAVAPVTHWKYYDNIYTERYNALPQENGVGYDLGSPLTYVKQLKGDLLLVHGSGDDNVHYQNSEALVNALVAANKPFTMMQYPDRNHSISGGMTSVHLRELMTRYLDEKLMGAPRPLTP
ncbi:MAG TPA: S9 family peptidase [Gemmatimonadales bacterium]